MQSLSSKSTLEKILNLFTDVKEGEGLSSILLTLNIFLIMTAYYIMKPVREALILSGGGAVIKSYASAGQVILLLGAVPLYGIIAGRFPRRKLINVVTFFFAGCLGVFYLLAHLNVPLGVIFFLWIGIFNLMVPAQFWAFANDIYTPEEGKRLFVLLAFGASSGAVLGGLIVDPLIEPLGVYQLLLLAGAILLLSLILTNYIDSREQNKIVKTENIKNNIEEPLKKDGAFQLVFKTKYLLLIAFLTLLLNWVNTNGEFILGLNVQKAAEEAALNINNKADLSLAENQDSEQANAIVSQKYIKEFKEKYIGKFYARFFSFVNIGGLLLQLFIVSRILKYFGIRVALVILPIIAFSGYFIMAFFPILSIIRISKIAENSTDYSLQNTVRQVLFLPTTREEKYKAKQAIDTFFWRAGDLLSTAVVAIGTSVFAFQTKQFALFNIVLVSAWLILAILIGKENKKLTSTF